MWALISFRIAPTHNMLLTWLGSSPWGKDLGGRGGKGLGPGGVTPSIFVRGCEAQKIFTIPSFRELRNNVVPIIGKERVVLPFFAKFFENFWMCPKKVIIFNSESNFSHTCNMSNYLQNRLNILSLWYKKNPKNTKKNTKVYKWRCFFTFTLRSSHVLSSSEDKRTGILATLWKVLQNDHPSPLSIVCLPIYSW